MATSGSLNTSAYKASDGTRFLVFSWEENGQSIANNTTTIAWTLKGGGTSGQSIYTRNIKVTIDGVTVYTFGQDSYKKLKNGTEVASGTYTFSHKTDGTKTFTAYVEAGIYTYAVNCTGTKTFTLDTIPRASSLTASNGTLAVEQTFSITRAVSTFKHRLLYRCGDAAGYIAGSASGYTTETSIKWTPPIGLAHENTTGTSVSVTLTLYTYDSAGTHIGTTTKTITCAIPVSVKPSVAIAWEDLAGVAGFYGSPVQGLSKLKITLTEQTSYSSPIASRVITANGAKYTEAPATTEVLTTAGDQQITATVKDQRGRSGSASVTLGVLAYVAPVVSALTVHRCNADGTENDQGDYIRADFSAAITDLNGLNVATYKLRYKASTSDSYTEVTLAELAGAYAVVDHSHVFPADGSSSYDVEIVAVDNHGTAARATSASTAFTLMNWNAAGDGMAIGKVSEKSNAVEFNLDLFDKNEDRILGVGDLVNLFYPVGSIVMRYDHTDPGTIYGGTWARISNHIIRGVAAGGTIGEIGTLADGSGRTYVNIAIWRRTA